MAMTPSGTRMRPTSRPLGRCHWLSMAPTGSGRPATCRQAARMSASTAGCRVRRSMRGASRPRARAASRSCALAVRSSASRSSSRAARRVRAAFLAAGLALASRRAASLAFWPSRVISCAKVIRAPWVGSSLYTLPQERGQGDGPLYGMSLYARISFFFWGERRRCGRRICLRFPADALPGRGASGFGIPYCRQGFFFDRRPLPILHK